MKNKTILGLDLGTTSIGWALVKEYETKDAEIIKLGVRVNPLTVDEQTDFEKGNPLSTNANRTLKRGARRNLDRYQLRRENLVEILIKNKLILADTPLTEIGKNTTHQTLSLRAKAAKEQIELEDLAKVLLAINKKRGYKSSRKAKNEEEGSAIDGMAIAKKLYENELTPGQYVLQLLEEGKKYIPDFYRSDLKQEFDKVWAFQKQFYPDFLTEELYEKLENQGKVNTQKRILAITGIYTAENKGKREETKKQHYQWRSDALSKQLTKEEVAYVLVEINNNLNSSSGYLGAISDRSKALYFNKETVGENLYKQIQENPHTSLKNQVFYRQDYLDEFEQIWETQSQFYTVLSPELKEEIRDVVIFYQRKLKSQKHLISNCQFEKYHKAIPKSSPLFQEFKIWQNINNLEFTNKKTREKSVLDEETRQALFVELNLRGDYSQKEVLAFMRYKEREWETNFKEGVQGNRTNKALFDVFYKIAEEEGYGADWEKKTATEILEELKAVFTQVGIQLDVLAFDANVSGNDFDKQLSYQLWHLLYASEDDGKLNEEDILEFGKTNVALKKKLHQKFGFSPKYGAWLAGISFEENYGSLSAKAIKKIIPFLQSGHEYSEASSLAGYNHSNSKTKEEKEAFTYKDALALVKKNSLRNPVVEKILNQMVNVVNEVITTYGKPNEIRIEMARELKQTAKQRKEQTTYINKATKENEDIRKVLSKEFGIPNPTKNDVIRYKLWEELKPNGYKTLFTNQYVKKEKLFSSEIDIEHIIPKAVLYDDSFSNKTLAFRAVNLKKDKRLAFDFIENDYKSDLENYKARVESLYNNGNGTISKGKYLKLLMTYKKLEGGFVERDLKNTQYIAKKAKEMLEECFKEVVTITGGITSKLREDWDLINVMKELNFPKYKALGLIEVEQRLDKGSGKLKQVEVIKDWTKRNDHRHHAMDALTVAFTTHNHVQYFNNLSASEDKESKLYGVRNLITESYTDSKGNKKRRYKAPMSNFRTEAKKHIESILISHKAKNKVVTKNKNKIKIKGKDAFKTQDIVTPRGQLHKETVYGKSLRIVEKPIVLKKAISVEQLKLVANKEIKQMVFDYIGKYENNPAIAFDAKTLKKDPLLYKNEPLKEVQCFEEIYTIRKDITPDLKLEKIVDAGIREKLQKRLKEFGNKPKEAFSNLEQNPIWLNKEKGIAIKRVTITGVSNAEPLHYKKDHFGKEILDSNGNKQAADYVSTGNNHHVAIYKDKDGKLQEKVMSFYEAVARVSQGLPVVDKTHNQALGWEFLFTMKQNEMFVFPNEDFDLETIDLLDATNATLISKNLFKVQSLSIVKYGNNVVRDFVFRNHLDSTKKEENGLKNITYFHIKSLDDLRFKQCVKVRLNHIGQIVQVGEY